MSSIWRERAWTFQEYVLSRRRLIFTAFGMLYVCKTAHKNNIITNRYNGHVAPELLIRVL